MAKVSAVPLSDHSVGLGYRRSMYDEVKQELVTPNQLPFDFLEIAPENWMNAGPRLKAQLHELRQQVPVTSHGLSLSIGSPAPLDIPFLKRLKQFLDEFEIALYSEHLSYCSDEGHLYDLMPIPFTCEAVKYVSERINTVSDMLQRRIVLENVSFYAMPSDDMTELEFITQVLTEADCDLLLDVNNVYVNSINHGYDPKQFISQLPAERVRYMHIAGHYQQQPDLTIDTHGADVIQPVWQLLEHAYTCVGHHPTLLERDFNIPPLATLSAELSQIRQHQIQSHAIVS